MLIKTTQIIKDLKGKLIKDEAGKEISLKDICINALLLELPEQRLDGREKYKRYRLAMKIEDSDEIDLPAEDIVLIKDCIAKVYTPLIMGRTWDMLDPEDEARPRQEPVPTIPRKRK